jgi:hypothetical protein
MRREFRTAAIAASAAIGRGVAGDRGLRCAR